MNAADIKGSLKQAKGLLGKGDKGQDALVLLRHILKQDGNHYQALVLEGAALQQIGKATQSLACYKKAIGVNPKQVLAWQGIVSHYEKKGVKDHEDLIEAYKHISKHFEKDEDKSKYLDATLKFVGQLQSQNLFPQCIKVLQRLIKSNGTNVKISQMTVGILGQMGSIEPEDELLYLVCLSNLHETEKASDEQYRKYFQLLYKKGEFVRLERVCRDLNSRFNAFYYPLDYLCRLYVENRLSADGAELVPVFVEKLFKLYPSSSFACFAQGKIFYEAGLLLEAISWLKQGTESKTHEEAMYLLILSLQRIWDWDEVEEYANKILAETNFQEPERFSIALANSLLQQKKINEASEVVETVEETISEAAAVDLHVLKGLIAWEEGRTKEFQEARSQRQDWRLELCHLHGMGIKEEAPWFQLIEQFPNNFDLLLRVGIELSELSAVDSALHVFQKCLCIFKDHPILLMHLARLYVEEDETTTALTYLKKAYKALPSPEIGMCLSDLYFKLEQAEANYELLNLATKRFKQSKSKWAWFRLGLLYLESNEPTDAVSVLQSAIRTDPTDSHVWEILAEAYYARGSYEAALKAFEQCLELGAEPTYHHFKMGMILRRLGEVDEAVSTLSQLHDYSPAVIELAMTHLQTAKKSFNEGLNVGVIKSINCTINAAAKALDSPESILALNIITDAIILGGELNPTSVFSISSCLLIQDGKPEESQNVSFQDLLLLGLKTAMTVCENTDSTHIIAYQHFAMGRIYLKLGQTFCKEASKKDSIYYEKALYHTKKSILLNPTHYTYWNALGITAEAVGDRSLALHAYLTSIQKSSTTGSAATWTNLGLLLRSLGYVFEAHRCFCQAQRFEPSYGFAWIGQGLVAEILAAHDEWTDLYRHAASLEETDIEANLCYSYHVARILVQATTKYDHHYDYTINHLDALHVSLEKISLFNVRRPSVGSLTIQGILEGVIGLFTTALGTFEKASLLTSVQTELSALDRNKLVVLQELGNYKQVLENIANFPPEERIFNVFASKALALEKTGEFELAFDTYQDLLALCSTDLQKSDVLISLGLISNRIHDLHNAKTFLFQGCGLASSPHGYDAIWALALLADELRLAASAAAKVEHKFMSKRHAHTIALMKSFAMVAEGADVGQALKAILSVIHMYPHSGKLWKVLANHYINFEANGKLGRGALTAATALGEEATIPSIVLTHLLDGDVGMALKDAQRGVLHNPCSLAAITSLVVTLSARDGVTPFGLGMAEKGLKLCGDWNRLNKDSDSEVHHDSIRDWLTLYIDKAKEPGTQQILAIKENSLT